MCRTSPVLDCQLCQFPGCNMVCGTAATEAITAISRATATQFQMQRAMNRSTPLPFPTTSESTSLVHAYNMASTRGDPTVPAYNALSRQMRIEKEDIKGWMVGERKAKGRIVSSTTAKTNSGPVTLRKQSYSIEIRARLPVATRRLRPSAPYTTGFENEYIKDKDSTLKVAFLAGFFWYMCYYPHHLRNSFSPVCGISPPKLFNQYIPFSNAYISLQTVRICKQIYHFVCILSYSQFQLYTIGTLEFTLTLL